MTGKDFRAAAALIDDGGNENTMAPFLVAALTPLLPSGVHVVFDETRKGAGDRPDYTIKRGSAVIGYIEAKRAETLQKAFKPNASGQSQIDRYRTDGLPILLTDGLRWYDVTEPQAWTQEILDTKLGRPTANFANRKDDALNGLALRTLLSAALSIRPRYSPSTAPLAMQAVISRINNAHNTELEQIWNAAKRFLRDNAQPIELGEGNIGELIGFTLLAIAASLEPLSDETFVPEARTEWMEQRRAWRSGALPSALRSALNDFRRIDGESNDTILGTVGWITIRSVAASLRSGGDIDWESLSSLWDHYLANAGQRETLGSWQTPQRVAAYQSRQAAEALRALGYAGFSDPNVTTIDPCCGTGVYMQEVAKRVVEEGAPPESLNGSVHQPARLLGADISPTAVAATHIRLSSMGVRPNLYMADTLGASPEHGATGRTQALFSYDDHLVDAALVQALKTDHRDMIAWAGRRPDRDPLVAIVGNPPWRRRGLDIVNYAQRGWYKEVYDCWRKGSGGGGVLNDPYVAFIAWAFRICQLPNDNLNGVAPFGVVSFITNRIWVDGEAYGPFRRWLRKNAATVQISDFGRGSRGTPGGRWSEQPFNIETGAAILTVTFDSQAPDPARVTYQRVEWVNDDVRPLEEARVVREDHDWTGRARAKVLIDRAVSTNGIQTSDDEHWVNVTGDRDFATRYAWRPFDNRFAPTFPPKKARRGESPKPGEASGSSEWRVRALFDPHLDPATRPDWYLVAQEASAAPGPALYATRWLPDKNFFNGRAGRVLPIRSGTAVPREYKPIADRFNLPPKQFWLLTLAVANHSAYWTEGTQYASQLAEKRVEPLYPDNPAAIPRLIEIGERLVDLWSMDNLTPVQPTGAPGRWRFHGHNEAERIVVHGRRVLADWRAARPGDWDKRTAIEYARSVEALLEMVALSQEVAHLVPVVG